SVFRMDGSEPRLLGRINLDPVTFSYDPGYLADPDARAVSCSLPLRNEAYSESTLAPYFDGLLPEGAARRAIAAQLGIEPDNYLLLLLRCGLETIGDVAITNGEAPNPRGSYRRLSGFDLRALFSAMEELANRIPKRGALAGTQGKRGSRICRAPMDEGWLQPLDGAASTISSKRDRFPTSRCSSTCA
ncbi:MAG: HipA N-terminal domain-containing protein, partial [Eggerthella lenta]